MYEVLKVADLEAGQINDVPMSTMYGLEARGLVSSEWRVGGGRAAVQVTTGGSFPIYRRVKLATPGIRAARGVQGMTTLPGEPAVEVKVLRGGAWIRPRR